MIPLREFSYLKLYNKKLQIYKNKLVKILYWVFEIAEIFLSNRIRHLLKISSQKKVGVCIGSIANLSQLRC